MGLFGLAAKQPGDVAKEVAKFNHIERVLLRILSADLALVEKEKAQLQEAIRALEGVKIKSGTLDPKSMAFIQQRLLLIRNTLKAVDQESQQSAAMTPQVAADLDSLQTIAKEILQLASKG